MFDYLVAEVLEQLPAELADFLLCAAVLPELDAARCAEVTGHVESDRRLDDLERLGLFVDVLDSPTAHVAAARFVPRRVAAAAATAAARAIRRAASARRRDRA